MKTALMCLLLTSCAALPPKVPGSNNCGMLIGGDFDTHGPSGLTFEVLADRLDAALDATTFTTAPALMDMTENCEALVGYKVYSKKEWSWPDPYGRGFNVGGLTWCNTKTMVVGTPESGNWRKSSLVHELIHGMQKCAAEQPPDIGKDVDHADWIRHGIYAAIEGTKK